MLTDYLIMLREIYYTSGIEMVALVILTLSIGIAIGSVSNDVVRESTSKHKKLHGYLFTELCVFIYLLLLNGYFAIFR